MEEGKGAAVVSNCCGLQWKDARLAIEHPSWLTHFFNYWEIIVGWAIGKLLDLAFEALREQVFPRLMRWWRKSQQHQQYRDIVVRIHVAEEINLAAEITAHLSHASISDSQ